MITDHNKEQPSQKRGHLTTVAWAILVMGISLAMIVISWIFIGHIGPSYSANTMIKQQISLRRQYGLPPKPVITDPKMLETPPSQKYYKLHSLYFLLSLIFFLLLG